MRKRNPGTVRVSTENSKAAVILSRCAIFRPATAEFRLSLSQMDDANLDNHHRNLGIILSAADFLHNCANNCGDLLDSLTRMEGGINLKQIAALKLCVQDVTCKISSIKDKSEKALSSSNQEASARVDLRSARRDNFSNILAGVGVAIAVVPSIDFAPWINALDPGKLSLVAFSAFAGAALIRLLPRPNLLKHTHDR